MIAALFLGGSQKAHAGDFGLNIYGGSTNLWSNVIMQIPSSYLSNLTTLLANDEQYRGGALRYGIFNVKEDGEKIKTNSGSFWGFKAKDLFANLQCGLKVSWAPKLSPFGIYVSLAYQYRQFEAEFDRLGGWNKYKIHSIRPGIGIRISPFVGLLEDDKWSPMLEVGTSYNYYFKNKAPFDNAKDQFNSGMISTFAIGARSPYVAISGGIELDHYSLFNKNFSPDGGVTFPYAGVKTNNITVFISISHEFN